jgi:hypothetical protein
MTTRVKLYIVSYTASAMMLLNVFSKPLHIPDSLQWILIIGVFVPLGWMFYLIKKQKQEKLEQSASTETVKSKVVDERQNTKKRLIITMVLASTVGLCAPLWLPLTGSTLGVRGDFICGIVTAIIVCVIFGIRLKKI